MYLLGVCPLFLCVLVYGLIVYPKMDLGSPVSVSECQIAGKSHPARLKVCYIFDCFWWCGD